jgi:hypothetical protein
MIPNVGADQCWYHILPVGHPICSESAALRARNLIPTFSAARLGSQCMILRPKWLADPWLCCAMCLCHADLPHVPVALTALAGSQHCTQSLIHHRVQHVQARDMMSSYALPERLYRVDTHLWSVDPKAIRPAPVPDSGSSATTSLDALEQMRATSPRPAAAVAAAEEQEATEAAAGEDHDRADSQSRGMPAYAVGRAAMQLSTALAWRA